MEENKSFVKHSNEKKGIIFSDTNNKLYPIAYYNIINGEGVNLNKDKSYHLYVYEGVVKISKTNSSSFLITNGMFASFTGNVEISKDTIGKAVVIEINHSEGEYYKNHYRAFFTIGGEIEDKGRLRYIDGCTDSLLIPPVKKGDPCLNHLHFPKNITQTPHTHPSHRIYLSSF